MATNKIIHQMNESVPDDAFDSIVRREPVPLTSLILTGTGVAVAANATTDVGEIVLNADDESFAVNWPVPLDYNESRDHCKILVLARLTTGDASGGSNIAALDIDEAAFIEAAATASAVTSISDGSSAVDSQEIDDVAVGLYEWDLSGNGMQGMGVLTAEIDCQVTGTAAVTVYGVWIEYLSTVVPYNFADRAAT